MRYMPFVACLLLGVSHAYADILQSFNLAATIENQNAQIGMVAGTVELDTTTGTFVTGDFQVAYLGTDYLFNSTVSTFSDPQPVPTVILGVFDDRTGGIFQLGVPASSLIGYTGSAICTTVIPCPIPQGSLASGFLAVVPGDDFVPALSGTLTPAVTATPDPPSLVLLSTGTLGLVAGQKRARRRRRARLQDYQFR